MADVSSSSLKFHRVLRGLTQDELAQKIGRTQDWISRVENGFVFPTSADARRIAKVLGIEPTDVRTRVSR